MIELKIIKYYNEKTMKMSDVQLRELKMKVDFKNEQHRYKNGSSNYESILNKEIQVMSV